MFEYVYLARPDSVMDGISVYQARLNMGETLAQRVISTMPPSDIDVVIPIPESSRPSAMQLAQKIGKPYREGFVKNRYVGRTFIMPGQAVRKKFGAPEAQRHRAASSRAATCCWSTTRSCAAPPAKRSCRWRARPARARSTWPRRRRRCAIPTCTASTCRPSEELIAHDRSVEEIRRFIGADALIYQDVDAMKRVVGALNPKLDGFEASCFDGHYITGDVSEAGDRAARRRARRRRRRIAFAPGPAQRGGRIMIAAGPLPRRSLPLGGTARRAKGAR